MSSNPTSDDATNRDAATGAPANGTGPADHGTEVLSADATGQPVELGKPDSTPTEVLGAQQDPRTEVISGGQSAEWWSDAAHPGEQPTQAIPATPAAHPGEAAYADSATVSADSPTTAYGEAGATAAYGNTGTAAFSAATPQSGSSQLPPGTPPPAKVGGGQGGSSGMRRNRKTLLIVGLVVALLLVGGLGGGEAYARHRVENCISSQFQQQMGSKIDVSFGWKPLLLTMFDNKVSSVTVDSDDTKFGPAQGMVVHATFNDVVLKDDGKAGGTIGSSTADVTWSNDGIVKTLGGLVSGATSDPSTGTLSFSVLGGLAQLQVKPQIVGDKVQVQTVAASLLGFGLPTDLVSGIVDLMTESLQSYPMGLTATKVEVTKDGLHIALKGGPADLQPAQGQQQTSVTC
ncbi:LmeA family phospholipid-binding protein [Nocardia sp. NBC_00511]